MKEGNTGEGERLGRGGFGWSRVRGGGRGRFGARVGGRVSWGRREDLRKWGRWEAKAGRSKQGRWRGEGVMGGRVG